MKQIFNGATFSSFLHYLKGPEGMLILLAAAMPLGFATWMTLLNNFSIERANFTALEIGTLQSLREIPGFLTFTFAFVLFFIGEQKFAYLSLLLMGVGVAITGIFSSVMGLYITTVLMSIGFHYYETVRNSLTMQLTSKADAPVVYGYQMSAGAVSSLVVFAMIFLLYRQLSVDYIAIYMLGGGATIAIVAYCMFYYPIFKAKQAQHKKIILRRRYWLYYALTFMGGARRQIFVVFAGFLMVEKFGYDVANIASLHFFNNMLNIWLPPYIGKFIQKFGERSALLFEYTGLIVIFISYAFVNEGWVAIALYILDHLFFSFAIAISTYFQKIADPKDIASSAGVAFSINHIAAVIIPISFGALWLISPAYVFLSGAAMATISLGLAFLVPRHPMPADVAIEKTAP